MKSYITLLSILLSTCAFAQDMNAVKYQRFEDPIIPTFTYQGFDLPKIPQKIEEVTFVWNRAKKSWEKARTITTDFNTTGMVTACTSIDFSRGTDLESTRQEKKFSYDKNGLNSVEQRKNNAFSKGFVYDNLTFIYQGSQPVKLIRQKDTLVFNQTSLMGKKWKNEYSEQGYLLKLMHTDKSVLGFTLKKHFVTYGDNIEPLFAYEEKKGYVDLYMPGNPGFFWRKYDKNVPVVLQQINDALYVNIQAYKDLVLKPNAFNNQSPQGENYLRFKKTKDNIWTAIHNKKDLWYNDASLTMRKITFQDQSVVGSLEPDVAFVKSLN